MIIDPSGRGPTPRQLTLAGLALSSVLVLLLYLLGLRYSAAAMATAATVAAKRRRGIYLLVPIVVPQSEPIDARMPAKERLADALIEEARLQIGGRLQGRWIKVRSGQFGRAVVEHAEGTKASAIVIAIPPASSDGGIRRSIDTVMSELPCRVILQVDPESRTVAQLAASRDGGG